MESLFTAIVVGIVIVANVARFLSYLSRRGKDEGGNEEEAGGATGMVKRELERLMKLDQERMAPPPRPGAPKPVEMPRQAAAPSQRSSPSSPQQPVARAAQPAPPKPAPAPRQAPPPAPPREPQRAPISQPATAMRTQPEAKPRQAPPQAPAPARAQQQQRAAISSGMIIRKTPVAAATPPSRRVKLKSEAMTPRMMRRVAVLSEIYAKPVALRGPQQHLDW